MRRAFVRAKAKISTEREKTLEHKALYMKKLKVYERKFNSDEDAEEASDAGEEAI